MDNEKVNENMVSVLVWERQNDKPRTVKVPAPNEIPAKVWEGLNKVFLKRLAEGWFAPLDPADAYHYVVEKLTKKLDSDKYKTSKDKTAYLIAAMYGALIEFGSRQVVRARLNAKCLANWQAGMAKKYGLPEDEVDVESLIETMPYVPRPSDTRNEARRILAELMPLLPEPIQLAFKAYIAANGNLFATAARIKMPWRTFCRKWPKYLATARKIAEMEVR